MKKNIVIVILVAICLVESVFLFQSSSSQANYEHDLVLLSDQLQYKENALQVFSESADVRTRLAALAEDPTPANAPPIEQQYRSNFMKARVKTVND